MRFAFLSKERNEEISKLESSSKMRVSYATVRAVVRAVEAEVVEVLVVEEE